jgi:hypothetical protein
LTPALGPVDFCHLSSVICHLIFCEAWSMGQRAEEQSKREQKGWRRRLAPGTILICHLTFVI